MRGYRRVFLPVTQVSASGSSVTSMIGENIEQFGGLPVVTVQAGAQFEAQTGPVAWRYAAEYDDSTPAEESLAAWLAAVPAPETVTALLVGPWTEPYENDTPVAALAGAADRFPALTHLFIGEMTYEENEISWINHTALDPVLDAYVGRLVELRVRGANKLAFAPFTSTTLQTLAFETGGMPEGIVTSLAESNLPALTALELWLGTEEYGAGVTAEELAALAASPGLGSVRSLGLRNSDDPLRDLGALADSALLARITSLDLSLGVVGDECVDLLAGASFAHLERIDLTHHYLTEDGQARLRAALPNAEITIDEAEELEDEDEYEGPYAGRWVETGE